MIQFVNLGADYAYSIWNWVDLSNLFLYIAFYYLRLHQINGLQTKIFPISFLADLTPNVNIHRLEKDFGGENPSYELDSIAEITVITILLIFTIIMKMFSLLRIFTKIGQFLEVFYKIVFATQ